MEQIHQERIARLQENMTAQNVDTFLAFTSDDYRVGGPGHHRPIGTVEHRPGRRVGNSSGIVMAQADF